MSYEKQKKKIDSIFVEAEDAIQQKSSPGDNIEALYDDVASVNPFETNDDYNDIDSTLDVLRRSSNHKDGNLDEEIEAMKKQLEL